MQKNSSGTKKDTRDKNSGTVPGVFLGSLAYLWSLAGKGVNGDCLIYDLGFGTFNLE